ncbi:hypothetical protein ABZW18_18860 [Streptomyces sp. NPDC004647]|uniref:hypothetical protein n=1 Tax=Streptomyces sp. NPDC004647 TaxID=3154671 RepID=UPI0033B34BE1
MGNALLGYWLAFRRPRVLVPGPVRTEYVEVPGPERVERVEVPGPVRTEIVEVPGPERVERVEVPGPERIVAVHASPHIGEGPLPTAVGTGLPLERDTAADTVVDGADLGPLRVRATSQRGGRNRTDQRHRRDGLLLHTFRGFARPVLLSVAAAGNPVGQWSQAGAVLASKSLVTHLHTFAGPLEAALSGDGGQDTVTDLVRSTLRGAAKNLDRLADRHQVSPEQVSTEIVALLTPLGDAVGRRHLMFGAGSGEVLLHRQGRWSTAGSAVTGEGAGPVADTASWRADRALPVGESAAYWRTFETGPGDLVLVCTGATAQLFRRPETADFFAEVWSDGIPDLHQFLWQTGVRVPGAEADRTLICLWEAAGSV